MVYQRQFINWIDKEGYDLLIGKKHGSQSLVCWRIKNENNAKLTVTIHPNKFNQGSRILNMIQYNILVKPLLQKYIIEISKIYVVFIGDPLEEIIDQYK